MKTSRLIAGTFFLVCSLLIVGLLPVRGESEIYDTVVRLHVLANSDSREDQEIKLQVRDKLLEQITPWIADCKSQKEAVTVLETHLEEIREIAQSELEALGVDDGVSVMLGEEDYPERDYDSVCFPSGKYVSLRVCIGDAEGKNWWCCLFPALCLNTAKTTKKVAEDAFVEVGLTPSQYKIITETDKPVYKARFKLLELFQKT